MAKTPSRSKTSKSPPKLKRDEALKYYRDMLLIRRFEERAGQLLVQIGKFRFSILV